MPIFGGVKRQNRSTPHKNAHWLGKSIKRVGAMDKRFPIRAPHWRIGDSLQQVEGKISFRLGDYIRHLLKKSESAVIVEWGCGNGKAIREICDRFGEKVDGYGTGDTAYHEWTQSPNARFIMETAEQSHRFFSIHRKKIDALYSSEGLSNLDTVQRLHVLINWIPLLKEGGILVYEVPSNAAEARLLRLLTKLLPKGVTVDINQKKTGRILLKRTS
jgi:hypothetical protein